MNMSLENSLTTRAGPSFGLTLIPSLVRHVNPLFDETAPPLPHPERVGTLPLESIGTLYSITLYAGTKWSITGVNTLDQTVYENFVNFKTQRIPSYYTAYLRTIELYEELAQQMGSPERAMDYLYTPDHEMPPGNWDVVRNWAIKEFLLLFVVSGNFRAYGWLNFPGWMGSGPFNDPNHLPYRGINYGK